MSWLAVDFVDRRRGENVGASFALARARSDVLRAGGEAAILETCQRRELYTFCARHIAPASEACERFAGEAAIGHLLRVAAGLESRLVGETEVLGQVRQALTDATAAGTIGPALRVAFTDAIRAGRRVRRETPLGSARSWPEAVCRCLSDLLSDQPVAHIAILGTGSLGQAVARKLARVPSYRLTIIGRDGVRAHRIARPIEAFARTLEHFLELGGRFDAVVGALRVEQPVITSEAAGRLSSKVFIDLGSLPNVDPALGAVVTRIELGALAQADDAVAGVADAEAVIGRMAPLTMQRLRVAVAHREALSMTAPGSAA
ncbi:MAG: hypothetical protein ACT4OZ_04170 [Gemmatimonadota bacterium]